VADEKSEDGKPEGAEKIGERGENGLVSNARVDAPDEDVVPEFCTGLLILRFLS
jgi:hypothetical protein